MLINISSDREFQRYLDRTEQRLHVAMVPVLAGAMRLQLTDGGIAAEDFIKRRGEKILVRHYKLIFNQMYTATWHQVQKQARTGVTAFMERMLSWIEREAATRIQFISQSTADLIRDFIFQGVQDGWSSTRIAREIVQEIPNISRKRSATIARTETHGAAMWAMDETIDEQRIQIQTKQWFTASDTRVRPSHQAMHGVTIARNEPFDTDDGQMMFPGDDSMGADAGGLINCRCSLLYFT